VITPPSASESSSVAPAPRWRNQWSIGVYAGPTLDALRPVDPRGRPALTGRDATDVAGRSAADPFLLVTGGAWHLFFEIWNGDTDRGEIAHATSGDGVTWAYDAVVLREPFHLSYPQVFEWEGAIWMVPESRQDEAVHLYVAEAFPSGWRRVATLVRGLFADATLVRRHDRWWMFAQRGLDELRLFSSPALDRGWVEHPASPLWPGNRRRTRPGGRVLEEDGRLVRFAQDAWPTYGSALRAFEILDLSETAYGERELPESPILRPTRSGWRGMGMHHLDAVRRADGTWLAVVDGATLAVF